MFSKIRKFGFIVNSKSLFFLTLLFISLNSFFSFKIHLNGGFYVCNKGIALGLVLSWQLWISWFIFLLIFFGIIFYNYQKNIYNPLILIYTALLCSGVSSNIIDRLIYGCVIDYIYLNIPILPIFNTSDVEIFIGILIILVTTVRRK